MSEEQKSKPQGEEPKIGVYICHCGGNISDHVDVEKVEEFARTLPGVTVARRNSFMCSDPGQEMIMEDVKSGLVDRVVVASCAPSLHETTFRRALVRAGLNPYLYDHANIREQVSWVHHGEGATEKASKLVAAAAAKTRHLEPLEPIRVDAWGHATVIGGGVAGLKAAQDLAGRGIEVTLVEKTPFLGGNVAQLDRVFPTGEEAGELIAGLASAILDNPLITVLNCAEVQGIKGYVGNFSLEIKRCPPDAQQDLDRLALFHNQQAAPGDYRPFVGLLPAEPPAREENFELSTGALVLATGFKHYTPYKGEYGYGVHPEVITLPDLIKITAEDQGGGLLKVNGRPVRSVALIHCVGSRHIPGVCEPPEEEGRPLNEYCSRVCCTASLQAAIELRTKYPDTLVYDLYRDIRAYGRGHEDYYLEASRNQVVFVRFAPESPPRIAPAQDDEGALQITVGDTLLAGEELEIPVDLVVLAVGMEAGNVSNLVESAKLPVGADRFLLEVHPKLRPVEVAVTGVLLAGTSQAPMDITEATSAASAAAAKAAAVLSRGFVELDPFVAEVNLSLCTGCGECVEACLREGALEITEEEGQGPKARINPALCQGCGVCVASCPENALQVNGWTLPQYEAMVDAIVASHQTETNGGQS